jgi:hypothetical protein
VLVITPGLVPKGVLVQVQPPRSDWGVAELVDAPAEIPTTTICPQEKKTMGRSELVI